MDDSTSSIEKQPSGAMLCSLQATPDRESENLAIVSRRQQQAAAAAAAAADNRQQQL